MTDAAAVLGTALADRYRIERQIGEGGMATVYLATDLKHGRKVAIKVLRPELAAHLGPERFLREIDIAANLQHPHILAVYDSGRAGEHLYYVMPFVDGESLRDRLVRGGALPAVEAARIAREVADALDYAHRHGVVHRDIKPANVLLSEGHAVVADFGIARAVSASGGETAGLTQAGMAVGTPSYMSPEQALGEQNLDGRTDIYSLGVVLHEMLEGTPPYQGTTPQSVVAQALAGKVPPLKADPLGLGPVIARAMAREPKDRFGTAGAMTAAIEGVTTGSGARLGARAGKRRIMIAAAAAAIAASLAFALWPRSFRAEGNPRHSLIIFPFENQTGDASRDFLSGAAMNLLGLSAAHWTDMRVHDDERTASLLRNRKIASAADLDFEEARAMAREAKVGTLVVGDIRREGDSLAIEAKVHDVRSGERLATHIVRTAWTSDPRPLFDQLAGQILGTSGAPPGERPSVLTQTTSSLEAYRAFLAGSAALQRFQVDSARELLERAVALDSIFALAYLRLSDVEAWTAFGAGSPRRRELILAAERHAAKLPPRLRSLVALHRSNSDRNLRRAREIAGELIARDSGDVEAWYQLGEAHFHHSPGAYPHPDTLGNIGWALRAFQRTLALDSGYVLAYQHILDALRICATAARWVCLADSSVYAPRADLVRQFGEGALRQRREDAHTATIATARGWVSTVPGSVRPRVALSQVLVEQNRFEEVLAESDAIARLGDSLTAAMMRGVALVHLDRPGEAAAGLDNALRTARDTMSVVVTGPGIGELGAVLVSGGLLNARGRLVRRLLAGLPGDSVAGGPAGFTMSKAEIQDYGEGLGHADVGDARAAVNAKSLLDLIVRRFGRDSAQIRESVSDNGSFVLNAFIASRDTTLLRRFLRDADTVTSVTWKVIGAHLALARGDTAGARMWVERHFRGAVDDDLGSPNAMVRSFAWGDLLSRLGDRPQALVAYARLAGNPERLSHPALVVRSWLSKGEIYEKEGELSLAEAQYRKFIAAWEKGDASLQPKVTQAREGLARVTRRTEP